MSNEHDLTDRQVHSELIVKDRESTAKVLSAVTTIRELRLTVSACTNGA